MISFLLFVLCAALGGALYYMYNQKNPPIRMLSGCNSASPKQNNALRPL